MSEIGFSCPHETRCAFCEERISAGETVRWVSWDELCHASCVENEER